MSAEDFKVLTHALVAATATSLYRPTRTPTLWIAAIACAVLPDLDVAALYLGIPYEHPLGHRGLTHSLPFAVALGVVCAFVFSRALLTRTFWPLFLLFSGITATHGLLDAATNGGLGIAFLTPFDNSRYFLPWRPLPVSPLSLSRFFTPSGMRVLAGEAVFIWLPLLLLLTSTRLRLRLRRR